MAYIPQSPETYQGHQVILNSDRLIFNAKTDSILLFSDKAIGFSTNGSFHFDTSSIKKESKFVVNSPNIYLGLETNNTLPTQPAVLGNELECVLKQMLKLVKNLIGDRKYKITYQTGKPGTLTFPTTSNENALKLRENEIHRLESLLATIKSTNTKLV